MSYYYGYRRRRRRLPYRSRVSVYRRRRSFANRSRIRRNRYKRKSTPNRYLKFMPSTRLGKKLTYRRKSLGLQPLKLKKHEILELGTQWVAFSGTTWSYYKQLDILPYDADTAEINVRQSHNVSILPGMMHVTLHLASDSWARYRIMLIKCFGDKPDYANMTSINPREILQLDGGYSTDLGMITNYTLNDEETTTNDNLRTYPFKVIKDFQITHSTTVKSEIRHFKLKIPARNIQYDPNSLDGTEAKNSIALAIVTTAPAATAAHKIDLKYMCKFIDSN